MSEENNLDLAVTPKPEGEVELALKPSKLNILGYTMTAVSILVTIAIIVFMAVDTRKQYKETNKNIDALRQTIDELDGNIKVQFEGVDAEIDKLLENDQAHTQQIEGINQIIENLKKTLKNDKDELNKRIDEVEQAKAEKRRQAEEATAQAVITASYTPDYTAPASGLNPTSGINNFNGHTESYYNLPMDGVIQQARNFGIEGEYWIRDDGIKMYGDYVICACNRDIYPLGSLVETSFGTGISLDTGSFIAWNPGNVDIATSWQ